MVCHDVCFENQVLDLTKAKYDEQRKEKGITKTVCYWCRLYFMWKMY